MSVQHWVKPDALGDILRQAWRPGVVEPIAIRVRPEVHARLGIKPYNRHSDPGQLFDLPRPDMVPFVIDRTLPAYPGFEIYRRPPDRGESAA